MKKDINQLITALLLGTITTEERQELDFRLKGDDALKARIDHLLNRSDMVEQYRLYERFGSNDDLERLQQLLGLEPEKNPRQPRLGRKWFYLAAACVAVLLIGGTVWYSHYAQVTPPEISEELQLAMERSTETGHSQASVETLSLKQPQQQPEDSKQQEQEDASAETIIESIGREQLQTARRITTYSDKEFWVTLPDGSLVHLNYNTRLVYPEQFTGDTREVILDGDAYFMVAQDRRHPFIVHTDDSQVRVYGTEFVVETQDTEGATNIILIKGMVSATPKGGSELMMKPGQKMSIRHAQATVEEIDTAPYVAWNQGTYAYDSEPLGHVLQVISKWYGFEPHFATDDLKDVEITGDFDRYETADNILKVIGKATGLEIEKDQEGKVIIRHNSLDRLRFRKAKSR